MWREESSALISMQKTINETDAGQTNARLTVSCEPLTWTSAALANLLPTSPRDYSHQAAAAEEEEEGVDRIKVANSHYDMGR